MQRVLIVEDEPTILAAIERELTKWQYQVAHITDWEKVVEQITQTQYDVILMDITLPQFDGFYLTKQIRQVSQVPIIFISAASLEQNAVKALMLGADDYLVKPFSLDLLVAKIAAVLKRTNQQPAQQQRLTFGVNNVYNPLTCEVTTSQATLRLTPTEGLLLKLLITNRQKIVSKEMMIKALWAGNNFIDQNALTVNVSRLRNKLATIGLKDAIVTVRKRGYQLEVDDENLS